MTPAPADGHDSSPDQHANPLQPVLFEVKRTIVGQDMLLERMAIALLCGGHLLVEGVPGLAKTLSVKSLAAAIGGQFQRIQFTPDLVPADLTGTRVYHQHSGEFQTQLGPVFTNLLLADEINRAPAKVQSALLEVMQEHQVTIGRETYQVPEPFLVMATQNPIESEGTYPLPEAQVDRFMMKVVVGYPTATEEHAIVDRALRPAEPIREMLTPADLIAMQAAGARDLRRSRRRRLRRPAGDRDPAGRSPPGSATSSGTSATAPARGPRSRSSPARGRSRSPAAGTTCCQTTCSELALDVLRHRIVLSYEALADDVTPDAIITQGARRGRRARGRPERPLSRCPRHRPRPHGRTAPERLLLRLEWQVLRRLDGRDRGRLPHRAPGTAGSTWPACATTLEGDDARHIDWNVTARLNEPQLRVFNEDRELTVWLVLDRSASMTVGAPGRGKHEVLSELAVVLARLFTRGGNQVGALLYDNGAVRTVPPGTGRRTCCTSPRCCRGPRRERRAAAGGTGRPPTRRDAARRSNGQRGNGRQPPPGHDRPGGHARRGGQAGQAAGADRRHLRLHRRRRLGALAAAPRAAP